MAGDGTTTATVLAQALVREGRRNVAAGANPMALSAASRRRSRRSTPTGGAGQGGRGERGDRLQASSSAADKQIGKVIAEAMDKVGKEGVITVEESNTFGLELDSPRACASTRATSRATS